MSDLVCLNTMERCPMPSMCRPFGGCSRSLTRAIAPPPADDAVSEAMVEAATLAFGARNLHGDERARYVGAMRAAIAAALAARGKP